MADQPSFEVNFCHPQPIKINCATVYIGGSRAQQVSELPTSEGILRELPRSEPPAIEMQSESQPVRGCARKALLHWATGGRGTTSALHKSSKGWGEKYNSGCLRQEGGGHQGGGNGSGGGHQAGSGASGGSHLSALRGGGLSLLGGGGLGGVAGGGQLNGQQHAVDAVDDGLAGGDIGNGDLAGRGGPGSKPKM